MDLIRWSPLRDIDELFNRYGRSLESGFPSLLGEGAKWRPAANIVENDKEYTIRADLPEVKKEDIEITVEAGVLTISGERRYEKSSDKEKEHRRETFYGSFTRSFTLPDGTDDSAIQAESKDGVLVVHIPKVAAAKRSPVSVKID
jgi:HSP20 family protein